MVSDIFTQTQIYTHNNVTFLFIYIEICNILKFEHFLDFVTKKMEQHFSILKTKRRDVTCNVTLYVM